MTSLPPPPRELLSAQAHTALLIPVPGISTDDVIFRLATTVSYWAISAIIVLAINNLGAIAGVMTGSSKPIDCPPALGPFQEAYTVRRFWGYVSCSRSLHRATINSRPANIVPRRSISWHQMLRSCLTGHADLVTDHLLPFLPRHSALSRYVRLTAAFLISGLIHWRADQVKGVPNADNGALTFFLLQAVVIILEDAFGPVIVSALSKHGRLRYFLGYLWVLFILSWSSPIYMFPGMRLGFDGAALLPFRILGRAR